MSNPEIKFLVSTPCNLTNEPSGYRLIQLKDKKLSSLPINNNYGKSNKTDFGVTTQAFCYLKPHINNNIPVAHIPTIMDYSDYMIISKSNGLIEIIKDYQYKVTQGITLKPDYVLACIPYRFNSETVHDSVNVGLEYKSGLLYCCQSNGDIFVFILNLPADYIQCNNLFNLNDLINPDDIPNNPTSATLDNIKHQQQTHIEETQDDQAKEIRDFFKETQYIGRSKLKHICFYLTPFLFDDVIPPTTNIKSLLFSMKLYKETLIYRPSICVNLEQGISHFHINPLDRLSFVTGSQVNPIMIRKIVLPMTYLNYFITYANLKKRVQEKYQMEILPWEELAIENGFDSFASWIENEAVYGFESVAIDQWNNTRNNGGTGYLKSIVVWKQNLNHSNDRTYEQLYRNIRNIPSQSSLSSTYTGLSSTLSTATLPPVSNRATTRGINRTNSIRRNELSRNTHTNGTELPDSFRWQLNSFLRTLQKNNALADFCVVNTKSFNNTKSTPSSHSPLSSDNTSPDMSNLQNNSYDNSQDMSSRVSYTTDPPQIYSDEHELNNLTPSFLTDRYKDMDILRIDKSLVFSVFKPKFQDEETTKLDLFCHRDRHKLSHESISNNTTSNDDDLHERVILGKALPNLSSFKKVFRLTKSLCLIVDTSGLLLIDLDNIGEGSHDLDSINDANLQLTDDDTEHNMAIRLSIFDVGLVNDAIVIMESFDLEPNHHIMKLNVITACLPGEIKAFEVEFDSRHIMGYTVLQDCLRFASADKFTDKMALVDCSIEHHDNRKRSLPFNFPENDVHNDSKRFKTND